MLNIRSRIGLILGKICYRLLRWSGRHGSTLPGLVIEKLAPDFTEQISRQLRGKIIVVTGTNGKTTTARILSGILSSYGHTISNGSGSNYTRGINGALMQNSNLKGEVAADFVVLEIDEAYVPILAKVLNPEVLLALNILRDQLDRYGEIDTTAEQIQNASVFSTTVIANALDPLLVSKTKNFADRRKLFGATKSIAQQISSEANLYGTTEQQEETVKKYDAFITTCDFDVFKNITTFTCQIGNQKIDNIEWSIHGVHNAFNAVAAMLTAAQFVDLEANRVKNILRNLEPAYGRGELLRLGSREVVLNLVKNPSGFNQNLMTYASTTDWDAVIILINDNYADGRDVSWLWDVDLRPFQLIKNIIVGGVRKYDMALCLKYNGYEAQILDGSKISNQLEAVLGQNKYEKILIFATYTAMLEARELLASKKGEKSKW